MPLPEPLLSVANWPDSATLSHYAAARGIVNVRGMPIRFVSDRDTDPGLTYENAIHAHGDVATRNANWHDFFNALVWLNWPLAKAALNALHIRAGVTAVRNRARDALTLLDESGVVVACAEPGLWKRLADADWHNLFVLQRSRVRAAMRFYLLGHALYEKVLAPYPALTGKCICIAVDPAFFSLAANQQRVLLDQQIAHRLLADPPLTPAEFPPLPLLGIPGVSLASEQADFYANTRVFRPRRIP